MNVDELAIKFPLDSKAKDYFFKYFSKMKEVVAQIVAKQMGMQLPGKSVSEICQIFFYVGINIENALDPRYKFGIDLVNKNFSKQVDIFRNDLISVAKDSISKGVPQDYILEYLCFYYEDVHKKLFPNEPIIL
jgi:hypothetical protein